MRPRVLTSIILLALTGTVVAQTPQKKFMAAPVTIEDQGSFFIGGVAKVTDYAAVPFVPPGQPGAIASAIIGLLRDEAGAKQLGLRLRARVQANYSPVEVVRRVESVYDDVAGDLRRRVIDAH